jgi:hypothetical protein
VATATAAAAAANVNPSFFIDNPFPAYQLQV